MIHNNARAHDTTYSPRTGFVEGHGYDEYAYSDDTALQHHWEHGDSRGDGEGQAPAHCEQSFDSASFRSPRDFAASCALHVPVSLPHYCAIAHQC